MTLRDTARTTLGLTRLAPWLPAGLAAGVPGLLRARALTHGDRPFLRTTASTWTYREADRFADRAARFWRAQGVRPGEVVALLMGNRPEAVLHQLALSRLGAAAALVNPELRGRALEHVLRASGARAVVTDAAHAAALDTAGARPLRVWDADAELAPEVAAQPARPVVDRRAGSDRVHAYLFTSGTTGLPKAAPIRDWRFLAAGGAFQAFALHLDERDVVYTPLPLYHASAQLVALSTVLSAGACLGLGAHFSARGYWEEASALGATVGVYVGEVCRYLLSAPPSEAERRHGIRTFVGNGLRADVWAPFQARFGVPRVVEFYGSTEGNVILVNRNGKVGSCGRPLFVGPFDNLELVRFDVESETHPRDGRGHLVRCKPDEVGELVGRIGLLPYERFDGYLDAEATDAKVLRDVFRRGDRWFRTGDLLRRDAEGDYQFVDRIGDTFRWKGENVSTQEVAELLAGAGNVDALAVYGVQVPGAEGRAGMAAVVCGPGGFEPLGFFARAEASLPASARPAFVRVMGDLERTSTQKFKKATLQREGADPSVVRDPVYVRVDDERTYRLLTPERWAAIRAGTLRL
jgi:fatty-acyl-CoA synthase